MDIPALTSHIDSITVYRQGALVSRSTRLPPGTPAGSRVKLVNLPLGLDDGSLRVRVEGQGPAPVASDVRVVLDLPVADDSLPPPDDEALEQARQEVQDIAERIVHLEAQRGRLEHLQLVSRPDGKRGEPPPPSPVQARLALVDFRYRLMAAIDADLAAARAQGRQAKRRRDELERRHQAASTARQPRAHELRKAAVVSLRGPGDAQADAGAGSEAGPEAGPRIVVEYMVPGARWAPSYAVHLSRDMSQATVSVRAVVAQRTGEDWTGVRLTLATADAQRWIDLPELQALRIGRRQAPALRRGWRAPPAGASDLYMDYDRFAGGSPRGRPQRPAAAPAMPMDEEAVPEPAVNSLAEDELTLPQVALGALPSDDFEGVHAPAIEIEEAATVRHSAPRAKRRRAQTTQVGGPPPAPPAAAPMAAMPMAPGAPPQVSRSMARSGAADMPRGGGIVPPAAPEEPDVHELAPEQLAYGDLRMPGPRDHRRGKLVTLRRQERYLELLWVREVVRHEGRHEGRHEERQEEHEEKLARGAVAVVEDAVRQARSVRSRALPPRHRLAASWDGFDYTYAAESAVDIPSDGEYHSVPLMGRPAQVALSYVVVPRESTDVFRRLTLHNPLDAPLLPGPADIYVGGDYLLTADLRATPQRGRLDIGLGVEQAVKVSRNTRFSEESAGLMGGSLALRHEIAIEVANRRDQPVRVEVQERLPVTREKEDEIQIDIGQVTPPWSAFEPEDYALRGAYRWQIELPPGQKQALHAAYTIKISAKKELAGGNRRES